MVLGDRGSGSDVDGGMDAGMPGVGTRRRREHSGRSSTPTTAFGGSTRASHLTAPDRRGPDLAHHRRLRRRRRRRRDRRHHVGDRHRDRRRRRDDVRTTGRRDDRAGGRRCDDAIDSGDDRRPGHDRGRQQRRLRVHADPGRAPRRRRGRTRPGRRPRLRHRCRLGQPVGAVQDEHRDAGLHHDGLGVGPAVHGDRGRRHRTDARRVVGAQRRLHRVDVPHPRRRQVPRRHAARRRGGRVQPRVLPVRPAHRRGLPAATRR